VTAGVVSYMFLCWGGVRRIGLSGIFLIFGTSCSRRGVYLPPRFCYVCVGLAHLVFYRCFCVSSFSHIFIVVFLTEFTGSCTLNTQRRGTPQHFSYDITH